MPSKGRLFSNLTCLVYIPYLGKLQEPEITKSAVKQQLFGWYKFFETRCKYDYYSPGRCQPTTRCHVHRAMSGSVRQCPRRVHHQHRWPSSSQRPAAVRHLRVDVEPRRRQRQVVSARSAPLVSDLVQLAERRCSCSLWWRRRSKSNSCRTWQRHKGADVTGPVCHRLDWNETWAQCQRLSPITQQQSDIGLSGSRKEARCCIRTDSGIWCSLSRWIFLGPRYQIYVRQLTNIFST